MTKLFVYGTLMNKHRDKIDDVKQSEMRFLGKGKIEGELFDLGEFPGAIEKKGNYVYGEVYELKDSIDTLRKFDKYEEFDPNNPARSLFIRKRANVKMSNGQTICASAYFYNGNTQGLRKITSGMWPLPGETSEPETITYDTIREMPPSRNLK